MLRVEFAITYGNHWFVMPVDQPVGSLTRTIIVVVASDGLGRQLTE
jgi:hypothetical protein